MTYELPARITAPGLLLRDPVAADATAVAAALDDPDARRFLPSVPIPMDPGYALYWCTEGARQFRQAGGRRYAVTDPATGEFLGGASVQRVLPDRAQAELGYWVAPAARNRKIATAAVRALTEAAFAAGLERIEVCAEWENIASQRVALAAGFRREGVRRQALRKVRDGVCTRHDLVAFARLRTDDGTPVPPGLPDLPGGVLSDGVVTLRPLVAGDADDIFELLNLPEVAATSFGPSGRDEIGVRCAHAAGQWLAGARADLVVTDAATGAFAGDIGLFHPVPPLQEAMIGYSLRREFRGRGFATRAVDLITEWAFGHAGMYRVIAGTNPTNTGSHNVLRRAGFEQEAYCKERLPGRDGTREDDIQWVRFRGK
ncbi:GNAT family N-acetyltransferase [Hamadaea tsunoensis]|uniref:GNAT family N-acetyltransferase n=1 Tax=Hamadaea tsunoensis TaxID=53368 RepID=UPI000414F805|nr:GNAT family N-acetyltransferase [Hamadaea tsunoensis]